MCARLMRLINAYHGTWLSPTERSSRPKNIPNIFENDDFIEEFLAQRWPINDKDGSDIAMHYEDNISNPGKLDRYVYEFTAALVRAERFMRASVNALSYLREIEPDARLRTPLSKVAVDWFANSLNHALKFSWLLFHERLRDMIMPQRIKPPRALSEFLRLLFMVYATNKVWARRKCDSWAWPEIGIHDSYDDTLVWPYVDIIEELENIQGLLKKQDQSEDRTRRSNLSHATEVVNHAFLRSSKVVVVRLDLYYAKGATLPLFNIYGKPSEPQPDINFSAFKAHLKKFTEQLFHAFGWDRLGYIIKIEYGLQYGFRAHVLTLLNGQKYQQDIPIARRLGEYWALDITQGRGVYWNCNAHKNSYKGSPLGMILQGDEEKRDALLTKVIEYLVKYDVPFDLFKGSGHRTFSTSAIKGRRSK